MRPPLAPRRLCPCCARSLLRPMTSARRRSAAFSICLAPWLQASTRRARWRRVASPTSPSAAGGSPVWFSGKTSSIVGAAWSNSAAASALDLDDGNRLARGHPGAAVIPTAFSLAAETGASFDDLIKAIVVGYEVGVSVAASRGFYARSGMWSCYGVVAAAGLLRRTPPDRLAHAFRDRRHDGAESLVHRRGASLSGP